MAEPAKSGEEMLKWGGLVVAAVLFVTFMVASFTIATGANDPPLLADPAPTTPPTLLCPASTLRATAPSPPSQSVSTTGRTLTPGATTTMNPTGINTVPFPASTSSSTPAAVVTCAAGEVTFAPQYRGGYDPNTRLMALLGIVVPLLTTIVAFYFGHKAGAGAGEAEKQKVMAQVQEIDARGNTELTELQQRLKEGRKL